MSPESFAKEVVGELKARKADMPFDAVVQLVRDLYPEGTLYPDGTQMTASEAVDWWVKIRLATSMSDQQWRTSTDPEPMLIRIRFHGLTKELTLFGCACCRRIWDLLPDDSFRNAVDALEKYLHGQIEESALKIAYEKTYAFSTPLVKACDEAWYSGGREDPNFHARSLAIKRSAAGAIDMDEHGYYAAANASSCAARARGGAIEGPAWKSERSAQADLLREILGNPLAGAESFR